MNRIALHQSTVHPLDPVGLVEVAQQAGLESVGLRVAGAGDVQHWWSKGIGSEMLHALVAALLASRVTVLDVGHVELGPELRVLDSRHAYTRVLEIGVRLGAQFVTARAGSGDPDELFARFAELAGRYRLRPLICVVQGTPVATPERAREVVAGTGGGIVLDVVAAASTRPPRSTSSSSSWVRRWATYGSRPSSWSAPGRPASWPPCLRTSRSRSGPPVIRRRPAASTRTGWPASRLCARPWTRCCAIPGPTADPRRSVSRNRDRRWCVGGSTAPRRPRTGAPVQARDDDGGRIRVAPAATRPPLEIDLHRTRSGVAVVVVRGAIAGPAVGEFERRLGEVVRGQEIGPRVVLDLSGLTSIATDGLDVLLDTQERLAARDGALELLDPPSSVVLLLHDASHASGLDPDPGASGGRDRS